LLRDIQPVVGSEDCAGDGHFVGVVGGVGDGAGVGDARRTDDATVGCGDGLEDGVEV